MLTPLLGLCAHV